MIRHLEDLLMRWLENTPFYTPQSNIYADWIMFLAGLLIAWGVYYAGKKALTFILKKLSRRTATHLDDQLLEKNFFVRLANIPALILIGVFINLLFESHPKTSSTLSMLLKVYSTFVICSIFVAFLNALEAAHDLRKDRRQGSIKGIIQAAKTVCYVIAIIFSISFLVNIDIKDLLVGLGGASAILLLVFRDSILGLVSGIQLSLNNMVLPGDWIEMPAAGADGTVIEISLITVKVQNWDNTIVTIPAYNLISQSVKNWRGMSDAGVRRIKRAIYIDMTSVKFCTDEMLERFRHIQYMEDYIDKTQSEIDAFNKSLQIDNETMEVNGRRQTNLGIFRAYLQRYLENHPQVSHDFTLMARQLQPSDTGMPIEVYVFAKTTEWTKYESIQSDIFDHIISSVPYFDLRVYQNPSWNDYQLMTKGLAK